MLKEILEYYKELKSVGVDGIVIVLAIIGTHFVKIYLLKNLCVYTKHNKGLVNGFVALVLSIIGSYLFTSFPTDFFKTIFASFIVAIGSQGILQWFEHKFFNKKDR